ncbi:MAG TPA: response regulator transcription factor [Chthonomonadaceae bacterium]|nr:response regulator transcription factor [Chthonomonadaceae bacterium]
MILLVEDDELIAEVIKLGLEEAGYPVDWATDGDLGLQMTQEKTYSLIVLDIMLPSMDGFAVCRALRAQRNPVPILMLTARDSLDDRVRGLDTGADDYLSKPFAFPELLARVRALLRRDKVHRARLIKIADLEIDTSARRVRRGDQEIHLTPREYSLLEALAAHEGIVLTREMIQDQIWMNDSYSNAVDWCIAQLRKKIDANYEPKLIQTVHRIGYRLVGAEDGGG